MSRSPSMLLLLFLALCASLPVAAVDPPAAAPEPPEAPKARLEESAWLGFFVGDAPDGGVKVVAVAESGPAAKAGILEGDLLLSVNQKPVTNRKGLRRAIGGLRAGEKVTLELLRGGKIESCLIEAEPRVIPIPAPLPEWAVVASIPGAEARELLAWAEAGGGAGATLVSIQPELRRFYGAPAGAGALVTRIEPGSPASTAGLKVGDVVVRAGGRFVRASTDLDARLRDSAAGAPLSVDVVRDGKPLVVSFSEARRTHEDAENAERVARLEAEIAGLRARIEILQREIERLRKKP